MFQGCSGVVPGLFRAVPGCSGGVPGVFRGVQGVFRGVPGCSRCVPGFTDTLIICRLAAGNFEDETVSVQRASTKP